MTEQRAWERGRLKIILGYAAGVGKTYKMMEEGQELKRAGRDVVIGYFEPHGRLDTIARTEGLEFIPRVLTEYRDRKFEDMDTGAILARRPEICLVDEFAHTNVPGLPRNKRWEDVMVLLEAGIDVITTMNIQHLESLNDQMREVTGVQVRETIPDWVMKHADEVVLVDLTPRALLNRLERGVVYGPDKARRALENFFKEPTLAALREMALRQTAHEVEIRQAEAAPPSPRTDGSPKPAERILAFVTGSPSSALLIRRGRRVADYLKAECFAVSVRRSAPAGAAPTAAGEAVERHLDFARKLHIETRILEGDDEAETLVDFARRNGVTQIYLARPPKSAMPLLARRHVSMRVLRLARDMQVILVASRRRTPPE
jgi:two-component system, OmpR family, sensor histidine kinase KdpD